MSNLRDLDAASAAPSLVFRSGQKLPAQHLSKLDTPGQSTWIRRGRKLLFFTAAFAGISGSVGGLGALPATADVPYGGGDWGTSTSSDTEEPRTENNSDSFGGSADNTSPSNSDSSNSTSSSNRNNDSRSGESSSNTQSQNSNTPSNTSNDLDAFGGSGDDTNTPNSTLDESFENTDVSTGTDLTSFSSLYQYGGPTQPANEVELAQPPARPAGGSSDSSDLGDQVFDNQLTGESAADEPKTSWVDGLAPVDPETPRVGDSPGGETGTPLTPGVFRDSDKTFIVGNRTINVRDGFFAGGDVVIDGTQYDLSDDDLGRLTIVGLADPTNPDAGVIVSGSRFDETIMTSDGPDTIDGGGGNDLINSGGGDDTVDGGSGKDEIVTGDGDDRVVGGSGADYIDLGRGDDIAQGGSGQDTIYGGLGNDTIEGGAHTDWVDGGSGADTVSGNGGDDVVIGGLGDDVLNSGTGSNVVVTGPGQDIVANTQPGDQVFAEPDDEVDISSGASLTQVNIDTNAGDNLRPRGSDEFLDRFNSDLTTFQSTPLGQEFLDTIDDLPFETDVIDQRTIPIDENDPIAPTITGGRGGSVGPVPGSDDQAGFLMSDGTTSGAGVQTVLGYDPTDITLFEPGDTPPAVTLAHEMVHVVQFGTGTGHHGRSVQVDPNGRVVPNVTTGDPTSARNIELDAVGLPFDSDDNGVSPEDESASAIDELEPNRNPLTENNFRNEFGLDQRQFYADPLHRNDARISFAPTNGSSLRSDSIPSGGNVDGPELPSTFDPEPASIIETESVSVGEELDPFGGPGPTLNPVGGPGASLDPFGGQGINLDPIAGQELALDPFGGPGPALDPFNDQGINLDSIAGQELAPSEPTSSDDDSTVAFDLYGRAHPSQAEADASDAEAISKGMDEIERLRELGRERGEYFDLSGGKHASPEQAEAADTEVAQSNNGMYRDRFGREFDTRSAAQESNDEDWARMIAVDQPAATGELTGWVIAPIGISEDMVEAHNAVVDQNIPRAIGIGALAVLPGKSSDLIDGFARLMNRIPGKSTHDKVANTAAGASAAALVVTTAPELNNDTDTQPQLPMVDPFVQTQPDSPIIGNAPDSDLPAPGVYGGTTTNPVDSIGAIAGRPTVADQGSILPGGSTGVSAIGSVTQPAAPEDLLGPTIMYNIGDDEDVDDTQPSDRSDEATDATTPADQDDEQIERLEQEAASARQIVEDARHNLLWNDPRLVREAQTNTYKEAVLNLNAAEAALAARRPATSVAEQSSVDTGSSGAIPKDAVDFAEIDSRAQQASVAVHDALGAWAAAQEVRDMLDRGQHHPETSTSANVTNSRAQLLEDSAALDARAQALAVDAETAIERLRSAEAQLTTQDQSEAGPSTGNELGRIDFPAISLDVLNLRPRPVGFEFEGTGQCGAGGCVYEVSPETVIKVLHIDATATDADEEIDRANRNAATSVELHNALRSNLTDEDGRNIGHLIPEHRTSPEPGGFEMEKVNIDKGTPFSELSPEAQGNAIVNMQDYIDAVDRTQPEHPTDFMNEDNFVLDDEGNIIHAFDLFLVE